MFFSFVIPVYNVDKYLRQCVDSILAQSYTDYEIILVDDGSTDSSPSICDEYAENYANINSFHKSNAGLSDTRNFGLTKAQGEYVLFIDSDDFYDDNTFLEVLLDKINHTQADAVAFSIKSYFHDSNTYRPAFNIYEDREFTDCGNYVATLGELISKDKFTISACGYAFKRQTILEEGIFFKKGIVSEDIEWAMRFFSKNRKLAFITRQPYVYRKNRAGSITVNIKNKNLADLRNIITEYADEFVTSDKSEKKILLNYLAYQLAIFCGLFIFAEDKEFYQDCVNTVKKYKWLFNYTLSPKVKKVSLFVKLFGTRVTIKALGFFIKHR